MAQTAPVVNVVGVAVVGGVDGDNGFEVVRP